MKSLTSSKVWSSLISDAVQSVLDGYNCTIFAYGQTGSGRQSFNSRQDVYDVWANVGHNKPKRSRISGGNEVSDCVNGRQHYGTSMSFWDVEKEQQGVIP